MFNFINRELSHFKNLPKKAQELLISFFFYSTAYPIISIFISAFIWKSNNNIADIIFFRVGQFIIIPIGFFLTGLLLKKVKINKLYFIGSIVIAVASVLTIFWKNETTLDFLLLGGLLGIGTGLYWTNRNYLTMKETDNNNRSYFFGILFSFTTLIGLVVALLTGWFIVFGMSYQLLITITFVLISISGFIVYRGDHKTPKIGRLFIFDSSDVWIRKRFIHFGIGLTDGLSFFLPGLLILTVLGNEGVLGTLTAISSILSTILIYIYGRKSHSKNHKSYFIISAFLALFSSMLMAFIFNQLTVVIYSLLSGLIANFLWLTASPIILNNVDLEVGQVEEKRFSYILDSETFLNIGRIVSLFICLMMTNVYGVYFSLRLSPLILSLFQVFLFICLEKFRKRKNLAMI
jgi:YQGE family putative transporter